MTKKDYIKLAGVIRQAHEDVGALRPLDEDRAALRRVEGVARLQYLIADVLAADNPRFDRERFVEACEPKEEA